MPHKLLRQLPATSSTWNPLTVKGNVRDGQLTSEISSHGYDSPVSGADSWTSMIFWLHELLEFREALREANKQDYKAQGTRLVAFFEFLADKSKFPKGHNHSLTLASLLHTDVSCFLSIFLVLLFL